MFNGSGFTIYYVLGDNSSFAQWTKQAGGDFASKDDLPIPPGQGLIFKRSSLSPGNGDLACAGNGARDALRSAHEGRFNFFSEPFLPRIRSTAEMPIRVPFGHLDRVQSYNGVPVSRPTSLYTDDGDPPTSGSLGTTRLSVVRTSPSLRLSQSSVCRSEQSGRRLQNRSALRAIGRCARPTHTTHKEKYTEVKTMK